MARLSRCGREKATVSLMVGLYCRANHGSRRGCSGKGAGAGSLCPECAELDAYAASRSERCLFGEGKTFCSNCKVHCYKPDMRERIREVMRFSGPRMIFRHPVMAIRHLVESKREERRLEKLV